MREKRITIAMVGCFDTKATDFQVLYESLRQHKVKVISLNLGVRGSTDLFPVDYEAEDIAQSGGLNYDEMVATNDRSSVIESMGLAASQLVFKLHAEERIQGVIGMGGGGGTFLTLKAMSQLPIGFPKLCISTVATKDLSIQVGEKDILLMPSVVDIAGPNKISRLVIHRSAAAIVGMAKTDTAISSEKKKTIAISMFGNTTECVNFCTNILEDKGFDVLAFHAVGAGGRSMEALIRQGWIDGVLDITTTELADDLCGGICSAGPERLTAASEIGIPQVVVPGCLDMVNFGHLNTVPEKYQDRLLYSWAPDVTLLRTDDHENEMMGTQIAEKVNESKGHVSILIPTKGISKVSAEGGPFYRPKTDRLLFDSIKLNLNSQIEYEELDLHINDEAFAIRCVTELLQWMD